MVGANLQRDWFSIINFLTDMTTIVAVTNRDMYRAAVISQRVENDFVTGLQMAKLMN